MSAPTSQTAQPSEEEKAALEVILNEHMDDDIDAHAYTTRHSFEDALLKAFQLGAAHQSNGPSSRDAVLEAAAEVCDRAASKWHSDYKIGNGPHRASSHREGMSDGADELATAIRALKNAAPQSQAAIKGQARENEETGSHAPGTAGAASEAGAERSARPLLEQVRREWYRFTGYSQLKADIDYYLDESFATSCLGAPHK